MKYEWTVETATLVPAQPTLEPPQVQDVLNSLELAGWEIFTIFAEPTQLRARIVARRVKSE